MNKIEALSQYLNTDVNNIQQGYSDSFFIVGDEEYLVLTGAERKVEGRESVKNFIDDCGIDNIRNYELFLNKSFFSKAMKESYKAYCEDIVGESSNKFENRLIEECFQEGLIKESSFEKDKDGNPDFTKCIAYTKGLINLYSEYLCSQESVIDFAKNYYDLKELCKTHPQAFDIRGIINYVIDVDGYGHLLSSYDGKENKFGGYYIYRVN